MARWIFLVGVATGATIVSPCAHANFHFYDFTEVFSNADGTIQFIEMSCEINNQNVFDGHSITSNEHTFVFPSNLPSNSTANTSFILATSGFASLPGAVTPDFIIQDNFFAPDADTLTLVNGAFSPITWTAGQLPVDGVMSLNRAIGGGTTLSTAINSPTNFAGDTGSIDLSDGSSMTEVYVDFTAAGGGDGSMGAPFNTLADAVDAVPDSGTIFIVAGGTSETILIDVLKQFSIQATGGNVSIGLPPPTIQGFRSRGSTR